MRTGLHDAAVWDWKRMLWLVIGGALLIRLWGTWYGLPFSYYADEYHEVMRALELGMGSFNFDRVTKGGFYLLLFVEYGTYFVLLKLMGVVATAQEFAEEFARDPSAFYLMGRMTAAVFGTITVAAAFFVARQTYSTTAGLLAALFLAVNTLHIDLSRVIGVDVPMTMLATLALYFVLRVADSGQRKDYMLAALCAALATTTKLTGIVVLLPLVIAHSYSVANAKSGLRGWFGSRNLWLAALVFAGVLVATNPGFLKSAGFIAHLFSSPANEVTDEVTLNAVAEIGGGRPNLYVFYLSAIQQSMGWPLFVLGLASTAYAVWRRTPGDVLLLSYALVNYYAIASTTSEHLYYPRYALPIIVVLAVLSGRALADLATGALRYRVAMTAAIVAGCVALPVGQTVATAYVLTQTDTRALAKLWFEANVPQGSRVLIEGLKIGPLRKTVPLRQTRESIQRRIEYWKVEEPKQAKFLELQLASHPGGGYDLEYLRLDSVATLAEYAERGIEYFVVRPETFVESRKADVGSQRLLRELRSDPGVKLIKRFEGDERKRPGPTIEIYRLVDANKGPGPVVTGSSFRQ